MVKLSSDASLFAWGGVVENLGGPSLECHGRWSDSDSNKSIATKEALALAFTIQLASAVVKNCRLDAHVDSMALIQSWERQGGKSKELNGALKVLYHSMLRQNVSLDLKYIPSAHNPADALSRVLSDKDCMLASDGWAALESLFGPNSIDLMTLDANAQPDSSGTPLKHFTPYASPASHGVNLFAQHFSCAENAYVFPPFVMVGPVLRFLGMLHLPLLCQNLLPFLISGRYCKLELPNALLWGAKATWECYFFLPHKVHSVLALCSGTYWLSGLSLILILLPSRLYARGFGSPPGLAQNVPI